MNTQLVKLDSTSAALALALTVAVLFNTALVWAKESYEPLKASMKALTGHHWTTQGLTVIVLFLVLGLIFAKSGLADRIASLRLIVVLAGSVIVAGLGLVLWFLLV